VNRNAKIQSSILYSLKCLFSYFLRQSKTLGILHTYGLIRQYVPKGSDVRCLRDHQIQHIMNRLNDRPRKSLGFLTPNEVFYERKKLTG